MEKSFATTSTSMLVVHLKVYVLQTFALRNPLEPDDADLDHLKLDHLS